MFVHDARNLQLACKFLFLALASSTSFYCVVCIGLDANPLLSDDDDELARSLRRCCYYDGEIR